MLNSHVTETHHPKITFTINDIINDVFEGNKDNCNHQLYNEEKLETIEEMSSVQEAARKMKEEEFIGSS
jgi:predicted transcriptional regulator